MNTLNLAEEYLEKGEREMAIAAALVACAEELYRIRLELEKANLLRQIGSTSGL